MVQRLHCRGDVHTDRRGQTQRLQPAGVARRRACPHRRLPSLPASRTSALVLEDSPGASRRRLMTHQPRSSADAYGAAGITEDRKGWLFRTARGHKGSALSEKPMGQPDAWRMIRRRAVAAGIAEAIGCHTFRATGITAYLANGGALEHAQEMAAHESPRTTKLYDRTKERLTQDEVERIRL